MRVGGRWSLLLGLVLVVLVADQLTKFWAVSALTKVHAGKSEVTAADRAQAFLQAERLERRRTRAIPIWRDHLQLKYVENPGAAWGLLGTADERLRLPFFYAVSVLAIAFILLFYRRLGPDQLALRVAMGLVLGGALGNFVDRIVRGYVIDFIDLHWKNHPSLHWPTFNVADVGISLGVALMLAETLLAPRHRTQPSAPAAEPAAPDAAEDGTPEPGGTQECSRT